MQRLATLVAVVAMLLTGCSDDTAPEVQAPTETFTVGWFGFAESEVLSQIYGQVLESEGIEVVYREYVSGAREVLYPDLGRGGVDLLPEYVGSALVVGFGADASADPSQAVQDLRDQLEAVEATALGFAPGDDKNGFAVTRALHESGVTSIADLGGLDEIRFQGTPECETRLTCMLALTDTYALPGVSFEAVVSTDDRVASLNNDQADVILVFTTQPIIGIEDLVVLEDPLGAIPAENIVPVVSNRLLAHLPGLRERLDAVSADITTAELIALNTRVEVDGLDATTVATTWLRERGHVA